MKENRRESIFLGGKRSRLKEFTSVLSILFEFIYGFRKLHFVGPCITVFSSAKFGEDNIYYKQAREFSKLMANKNFTIMTGGGPGIMEAANRGAKDVSGMSIGCNIELPKEQHPNPYLDFNITLEHFYVRKVLLLKYSYAFAVFPGGFGTMDEFFETLTLLQTNKISNFPVVLFGKKYWSNLLEQTEIMVRHGTISKEDLQLFLVTDSVTEGIDYIYKKLEKRHGASIEVKAPRTRWWFGERL
ncbi:TIGR00730 family Rossman fold protein [Aureibaculum algae]|uniref:Cytokinin riboside 5'-monophosphate phosphoribohydrolase n=1 Tax=Aureibaculum algae TaxID=2584122 RepID=A0A5B7TU19_9FLAO|nr:TIGR00730 family Rossman fold protein [Aureibaculum algae]QCX38734.1 TIGR00730 family Rossman fold protein [Aureibaculum algae]